MRCGGQQREALARSAAHKWVHEQLYAARGGWGVLKGRGGGVRKLPENQTTDAHEQLCVWKPPKAGAAETQRKVQEGEDNNRRSEEEEAARAERGQAVSDWGRRNNQGETGVKL